VTEQKVTLRYTGLALEDPEKFVLHTMILVEVLKDRQDLLQQLDQLQRSTQENVQHALLNVLEKRGLIGVDEVIRFNRTLEFPSDQKNLLEHIIGVFQEKFGTITLHITYKMANYYDEGRLWQDLGADICFLATADHWMRNMSQGASKSAPKTIQANLSKDGFIEVLQRWKVDQMLVLAHMKKMGAKRIYIGGLEQVGDVGTDNGYFPAKGLYEAMQEAKEKMQVVIDFNSCFPTKENREEAAREIGLATNIFQDEVFIDSIGWPEWGEFSNWLMQEGRQSLKEPAKTLVNVCKAWGKWKIREGTYEGNPLNIDQVDRFFKLVREIVEEKLTGIKTEAGYNKLKADMAYTYIFYKVSDPPAKVLYGRQDPTVQKVPQ